VREGLESFLTATTASVSLVYANGEPLNSLTVKQSGKQACFL